ncbi:MAG: hypothetical protein Q9227_004558 [Pyrenula ochraceoflavens]
MGLLTFLERFPSAALPHLRTLTFSLPRIRFLRRRLPSWKDEWAQTANLLASEIRPGRLSFMLDICQDDMPVVQKSPTNKEKQERERILEWQYREFIAILAGPLQGVLKAFYVRFHTLSSNWNSNFTDHPDHPDKGEQEAELEEMVMGRDWVRRTEGYREGKRRHWEEARVRF